MQPGFTATGKKRWYDIITTPIKDEEGNVTHVLELVVDITEKKKMEKQLREYSEQLEQKVEERTKDLNILNAIIQDITSSLDLKDTLTKVVKNAAKLVGGDAGAVALLDEEKGVITYPYFYNMPEKLTEIVVPKGSGLAGHVMETKKSIILEDYPSHPAAVKGFVEAGLKVLAAVPIVTKDRVIGALGIFGLTPDKHFSQNDIILLEAVGRQAAIAIENARLYEEIKRLKEFNEGIVQSMGEGILIEDAEGFITFVNPRTEEMLGYSKDELIGKHWTRSVSRDYQKKVKEEASKRPKGVKGVYEVALVSKTGKEIPVIVSANPLLENGEYKGVLAVFTDITERKKAEEEMMERMLKYKVGKGDTYLVKEKKLERGMDIFLDLINAGYRGLIISRTHPEEIREMCRVEVPIIWLGEERADEMTVPPEFPLIEIKIEDFIARNRVVLLDRLDYLITRNGFKATLTFIQKLSELFYIGKSILIISIDPDTLTTQELSLLEKESKEAKLKFVPALPEDLYEILEFVHQQNRVGKKPHYYEIAKRFNITRVTTRKRINKLKVDGLIIDRKKGRYKVLELTEKGKDLF
jgi:PAS domain S-box-containing protein